ncbi:MAG: hypothetical protein IKA41_08145 [Bacteroidaceae bacterium]|nr:hypothetical protein [Bacteroidaceae bacterium]
MNAKLKFRILTGVAFIGALCFATACNDDWNEHYGDTGVNTGQTLYQIISDNEKNSDLSDFCEVLNACGCADSLLAASRVYTLWAPVNGSFDKQQLLDDIRAGKRDEVLNRFVLGHITDYLHPANGTLTDGNSILLLNKKVVQFSGKKNNYRFGDVALSTEEYNIRARNGILHKLSGGSYRYMPNIWEYLAQDERISKISEFLYSYHKKDTLWELSIEGPIVNGVTTYLDTVYAYSNTWFNEGRTGRNYAGFGDISSEDSSYIMIVPTNDVWDEMVAKTRAYFTYEKYDTATAEDIQKQDSLQECYSQRMLCNYLVFNKNEQDESSNYLLSTFLTYDSELKYVRRRLEKSRFMDGVVGEPVQLSNGEMYITEKYPYNMYEILHDTIIVEAESSTYTYNTIYSPAPTSYNVKDGAQNENIKGKISNEYYLAIRPTNSSSKPSITFTIPNTLAASYYISIVFVPKNITDQYMDPAELKPANLKISLLKEYMLNNKKQTTKLYSTTKGVQIDPTIIDTLTLYNEEENPDGAVDKRGVPLKFKFDFCEYGKAIDNTTIKLCIDSDPQLDPNDWFGGYLHEQGFNIDCIILEPVESDSSSSDSDSSDTTTGDNE